MMDENIYKSLLSELDSGKKAAVVTIMNENDSCQQKFVLTEENLLAHNYEYDLDQVFYQEALSALESGNLKFVKDSEKGTYLIEPYFPEPRLIVFGGGHIAKPLVEFGAKVGFLVTVIDDRPSFANTGRFPDAENVICESFDKCFEKLNINKSCFVVIITRGHRHDLDCLKQVLKYNTSYIGMIGSKRRVRAAIQQLADEGYSQEILDKVNSPIGLEIGAVIPEEIAVSIIAQVISYRRLVSSAKGGSSSLKVNWPEFDRDVLGELSKGKDDPKAIVTIVGTKGSVPRKEGAKMLVWPHGKTSGSIGGGCSEGEVIVTARDIVREGGYKTQVVDMTGQVAEDEGMVCGGIMEVVIESYMK